MSLYKITWKISLQPLRYVNKKNSERETHVRIFVRLLRAFPGGKSVADFRLTCFPGQPSGKLDEAFRRVVVSNINWNMILSLDRLVHPNTSTICAHTHTCIRKILARELFPLFTLFALCFPRFILCASSETRLLNSVCILIFDLMSCARLYFFICLSYC